MNQKAAQKERSHEAILASAGALLRERGIAASSVGDVMRGAGLTVGGFYGHFASKEALFVESIGSARAMWRDLVARAEAPTRRERALAVLGRYASRLHRDHPAQGCILPNAVPEVAREGEPYRSALEAEVRGFVESFAARLGPEEENRDLALGLIALMYGALSLSRALKGTPLSDEVLLSARRLTARLFPDD